MLQLLLEGGQSYEDIGSLLGIAPDEARTRAHAALSDMAGADPDGQVELSDYLLGQADPIGRADAVRHLQADPEANATAERLVQQLKLLAPKAQLPDIPAARGGRSAPPPPPPATATPTPSAPPAQAASPPPSAPDQPGVASRVAGALSSRRLPEGKRRIQLFAGLGALLVVAIVAIIITAGGGGGGSDCKPLDTSAAQSAGVPTIAMKATGSAADASCAPSGQVILSAVQQQTTTAQAQGGTFALQINAANLEPTGGGDTYLLWLYKSDSEAFPLGQQTVTDSGDLTGAVPLNAQQVLLLTAFDQIRLSRVTQQQVQQVQQSVQSQAKASNGIVNFVGTPVLEGSVSELGLNQLLQQAQQQAGGGGGAGAGAGGTQGGGAKGGT